MADKWKPETEPQLWNHPISKLKEDKGKIKSYKSLPVKLFFSSLPYFLAQSQNLTKGKGRHNMCEDIVMKTSSTDNCEYSRDQTWRPK